MTAGIKLLVLFNNYLGRRSTNTPDQAGRALEMVTSYSELDVDVVCFTTLAMRRKGVREMRIPWGVGREAAFLHRRWLDRHVQDLDHDYVMYMENDLLIPERSVLNVVAMYRSFSDDDWIPGFIRYEDKGGWRGKEYIDMLPWDAPTVASRYQRADAVYWSPGNRHSGCWLLSRDDVERMVEGKTFQRRYQEYERSHVLGPLESAATDVYDGRIKVLPEDFASVEIEHLPNKYYGLNERRLQHAIDNPTTQTMQCQPAESVTDEFIRSINDIRTSEPRPRVSVVIPTLDTRELLRDCLASIDAQRDEEDLEVIVVDNASADGTEAMVRQCFPWVQLIRSEENLGYSGGANLGLRAARGALIAVTNSDTVIHRGALTRLHDQMCTRADVAVGCPRLVENGSPILMRSKIMTAWDHQRYIFQVPITVAARNSDESGYVPSPSGACLCFTRRGLEALGGLDEGLPLYLEEQDVARRTRAAGLRCYYVADALVTHIGSQTSAQIDPNQLFLATHRSYAYFYDVHFRAPASVLLRLSAAGWMMLRILNSLLLMSRDGRTDEHRRRLDVKLAALRAYLLGYNKGRMRLAKATSASPRE